MFSELMCSHRARVSKARVCVFLIELPYVVRVARNGYRQEALASIYRYSAPCLLVLLLLECTRAPTTRALCAAVSLSFYV